MPSYISSLILFHLVLLLSLLSFSDPKLQEVELQQQNNTEIHNTTISPFLTRFKGGQNRQRQAQLRENGCWLKPWICRKGVKPFEPIFCCRNRCINISSDPDNCGFCGIRCPFMWKCCRGICVDTMINPFHCGECDRKCLFPYPCLYGICGYAEPAFPRPPKHFKPPKHLKPSFPFPPGEDGEHAALGLREEE